MIVPQACGNFKLFANGIRCLAVHGNAPAFARRRIDDREVRIVRTHECGVLAKSGGLLEGDILIEQVGSSGPFQRGSVSCRRSHFELLRKHLHEIPVASVVINDRDSVDRRKVAIDGILVDPVVRLIRSL